MPSILENKIQLIDLDSEVLNLIITGMPSILGKCMIE